MLLLMMTYAQSKYVVYRQQELEQGPLQEEVAVAVLVVAV